MPIITSTPAPLERYGHNLTALARQGAFSPLAGQEAVMNRIFQILARKNKNNPVLVDYDEGRRWALVAEAIRRMAVGDAPDPLPKLQVIALDYEALVTNLPLDDALIRKQRREQMMEQWNQREQESDEEWWARIIELPLWPDLEEWVAPTMALERLQSMFIAMKQSKGSFLLFVDHIHCLLGGERDGYSMDATTLLKPALARNEVQLIGTCNLEQYRQHIEQDAAMQRRFQEICPPGGHAPAMQHARA